MPTTFEIAGRPLDEPDQDQRTTADNGEVEGLRALFEELAEVGNRGVKLGLVHGNENIILPIREYKVLESRTLASHKSIQLHDFG